MGIAKGKIATFFLFYFFYSFVLQERGQLARSASILKEVTKEENVPDDQSINQIYPLTGLSELGEMKHDRPVKNKT